MLNTHLHRDANLGVIFLALGQSIVIGAAELRPGRQSAIDPTWRVSLTVCGFDPVRVACGVPGNDGRRRGPELWQYSHLPPAGEPHR